MNKSALETNAGQWSLLHETAHAVLDHHSYQTDVDLLLLEVAAWQKAVELGEDLQIQVDSNHVQDCLDTYRDWLYARSTCPTCTLNSLQIDETTYQCLNCSTRWSVSHSRFCRPYRMLKHKNPKSEALNPKQSQNTKSKTAQNVFA